MGKVKEVKSKSGKASAKPLAVKNAGVTKASQTAGAKSKKIAKEVAIKASKKDDKKKKKVEISSDSESDSDSGSGSESSASSDSDSSESEAEKKPTKAVANGKAKATAKVAESSESDSESESGSDSDSESKSESDSDAKPAAAKATSNGDVAMADGSDADSSDSESEDDSDSDSDSEEQTKAKPAKAAAGKKAVNGSAKAEESSADSESDADSDDSSEEDSDDSESDSDDSESEEAEEDTKAPSKKRKADENEEAPAKKSKTDAAQSDKPATLFVGNLSWNVDDAMLQEEFKFCGEVVSARVITDRESGRSKGFGYVDFASPADAEKAHAEKQGAFIDGRQIKVDFSTGKSNNGTDSAADRAKKFGDVPSPESDTLFVGNLPFDADEDVVGAFFGEVAEVKSLRLPTDQESGRRKGFGYVTFNSVEDAKAAFTKLAGQSINGRPCRLDYSTPKPAREGGGFGGGGRGRGGFGGRGGGGRGGGGRGGGGRGGFGGRGGARGGGGFQGKKITF